MKTSTRKEIFSLPQSERMKVVRDLLNSVPHDDVFGELTTEEVKLIEERIASADAHPEKMVSWQEVKSKLRKSRARKKA